MSKETNRDFWLAMIAIAISLLSAQYAYDANQISKMEMQPTYTYSTEYIDNDEIITIKNVGHYAHNFYFKPYTFLVINYDDGDYQLNNEFIPIIDYNPYYYTYTGNLDGEMGAIEVDSSQNYIMINSITSNYINYVNERGKKGSISIHRYILVSYTDIYGEYHEDMYLVIGDYYRKEESEETSALKKIYFENSNTRFATLEDLVFVDDWGLYLQKFN